MSSNIIQQYKEFVGDLDVLLNRFSKLEVSNRWQQVLTSRSTGIMGTGISFSSVSAIYKKMKDGSISLLNSAYNTDFSPVYITGVCKVVDKEVPTCRVVSFDKIGFEGEYWITYISADLSTFVVSAPIVILGKAVYQNFGVYVLTKDRTKYWANKKLQKEINEKLIEYGYTNYFNKPVFSGESNPIIDPVKEGQFSQSKYNFV